MEIVSNQLNNNKARVEMLEGYYNTKIDESKEVYKEVENKLSELESHKRANKNIQDEIRKEERDYVK